MVSSLKIKAAEGTIVPKGQVLMVAENTDPKCPLITNYFETPPAKLVSDNCRGFSYSKKIIHKYLKGNPDLLQ